MMASDYILDIGPGAGAHGGEVVCMGTPPRKSWQTPTRSPAITFPGAKDRGSKKAQKA